MTTETKTKPTPNKKQQLAIDTYKKDGRYLIIAGPGTGKTFTVTKRIEAILNDEEKGSVADRILCLTFSDAAAREMRNKLEKEHVVDAAGVNIYTYHSFCMDLMEQNPDIFNIDNKSLINEIQKQAIVKECLDELEQSEETRIKLLRSENNLYSRIDDIVQGIEAIKHNRLSLEKIDKNLENNIAWKPLLNEFSDEEDKQKHQNKIDEIIELKRIYKNYCEKTKDFIDFDDMINNVLDEFEKNPNFLTKVANSYDFILVDEYQDTNKSQNEIVFNLANSCKNIFVVGDDDQIIYSFQGASLDTIQNFKEQFENLEVICFEENRRSTQTILTVAEELAKLQDEYPIFYSRRGTKALKEEMANKKFPLRFMSKELKAFNEDLKKKNKPVNVFEFSDEKQELLYIVNKVKEIIDDETLCPVNDKKEKLLSEIAVLTKTNADAYNYANKLKERGIRAQLAGGKNIFESNSVKVLIAYMQFLANPEQNPDKLYKYLLSKPFHINPKDYKILHSREVKDVSSTLIKRMEQAIQISDREQAKSTNQDKRKILADRNKLQNFIDTFKELNDYIACESVKNSLIQIANKTGILKSYLTIEVNRMENYAALNRLLDETEAYTSSHNQATFKEFVNYLNTLIEGGIRVNTDKSEKPFNAVQVCTLHSSKGREFEYVFMPGIQYRKYESNSKDDCQEIVPMEAADLKVPDENLDNIGKLKDKSTQIKFLNSAKLLYVGMTRAKHFLAVSYITKPKVGQSWFLKTLQDNIALIDAKRLENNENAQKLIEYNNLTNWEDEGVRNEAYEKELQEAINKIDELKEHINAEYREEFNAAFNKIKEMKKILEFTIAPDEAIMPDYNYSDEFVDFISDNIPKKHSVSSINTYLDCPKKYFYQYILHLSPEINEEEEIQDDEHYAEWGTIIHYALEKYVQDVIDNKQHFPFSTMEMYFDEKQNELIDNANESTINIKKERLHNYYNELIKTPADNFCRVEMNIPDEEKDGRKYIEIEGINFGGKIDRIDDNKDGTYTIYDYKTGINKDKVQNAVKIGGQKESIYNQLAFYKYVLETEYNMNIKDTGIIFPEEPENSFTAQDLSGETGFDNCKLVIDKYVKAVKEDITQNHIFECKKGCNKGGEHCYCDFKDFCKANVL